MHQTLRVSYSSCLWSPLGALRSDIVRTFLEGHPFEHPHQPSANALQLTRMVGHLSEHIQPTPRRRRSSRIRGAPPPAGGPSQGGGPRCLAPEPAGIEQSARA